MVARPWQEGPPELPGDVRDLPEDWWIWLLAFAAASVLLWWLFAELQRLHQQRAVERLGQANLFAQDAATSIATQVEDLRNALANLSATQQQEAERLSWLLREEVGYRLQRDCHSDTDCELLHRVQCIQNLEPLLVFVSAVLYANHRPTAQVWQSKLDEVLVWLTLAEQFEA
jgi:hypothetical protein